MPYLRKNNRKSRLTDEHKKIAEYFETHFAIISDSIEEYRHSLLYWILIVKQVKDLQWRAGKLRMVVRKLHEYINVDKKLVDNLMHIRHRFGCKLKHKLKENAGIHTCYVKYIKGSIRSDPNLDALKQANKYLDILHQEIEASQYILFDLSNAIEDVVGSVILTQFQENASQYAASLPNLNRERLFTFLKTVDNKLKIFL